MEGADLYIDVESIASLVAPEPWWPGFPPELPYYELWLESGADRPKVRDPSEIKTGNRKPENAAAYIEQQIEQDREAQRAWDLNSTTRYDALIAERQADVDRLWGKSTLDGFLGGQIGCIGVALGESGRIKLLEPDSDPLLPPDPPEAVGRSPEQVASRLWLSRNREYRMIKRLGQLMQHVSTHGCEKGQQRRLRLIAWNGFGFDFQMLALRAAANAQPLLGDGEPEGLRDQLSADGFDPDVLFVCQHAWHGVPWRSQGTLADPRIAWSFGDSPRFVRGKLPNVARFFGFQYGPEDESLLAVDHEQIPTLLTGTPDDRALAHRVCALDVKLLQHVHSRMLDLGIG